ncbi:MAG: signal peptidase I [Sporolactobacillus sp.]
MNRKNKKNDSFAWFRAIGLALLVVIIIRTFIIGNYIVDGPSMMPTLHNGDRLLVNKVNDNLTQPKRFDIVIFHAAKNEDYVKRVIGLPGDKIRYTNDQLYVNGKRVAEPYLQAYKRQMLSGQLTWDFSLKSLTGSARVPKGELWVMGDNRQKSVDSRSFFFIREKNVIGKVDWRYWPIRRFGQIGGN